MSQTNAPACYVVNETNHRRCGKAGRYQWAVGDSKRWTCTEHFYYPALTAKLLKSLPDEEANAKLTELCIKFERMINRQAPMLKDVVKVLTHPDLLPLLVEYIELIEETPVRMGS